MFGVQIMELEAVLAWIRAWVESDWPKSPEQAYFLRDRLGWEPHPKYNDVFWTCGAVNEEGDGYIIDRGDSEGGVDGFRLFVTSFIPPDASAERANLMRLTFCGYMDALTISFGRAKMRGGSDGGGGKLVGFWKTKSPSASRETMREFRCTLTRHS